VRLIKLAFISIIIIFLIATGFSLMIPSHIRISKAINMHTSKNAIFPLIQNQEEWKSWHPAFIQNDSTPKFDSIHIVSQHQSDSELVMQLQQGKKDIVTNGWKIYEYAGVDSVTLQWYMDFHLKWYPWKKFGSLFYENTYGVMMQEGLENIKGIVER
jgi:hypothetical protein